MHPHDLSGLRTVISDLGLRLDPQTHTLNYPYIRSCQSNQLRNLEPSMDSAKFFLSRKELGAVGSCIPTLNPYGGPALSPHSPGSSPQLAHRGPRAVSVFPYTPALTQLLSSELDTSLQSFHCVA